MNRFILNKIKNIDANTIDQLIIDRQDNKTYTSVDSYFESKNIKDKKVYYNNGEGPFKGMFSLLFLDYHFDFIQDLKKKVILCGSSSNSLSAIIYNCKKKMNIINWANNFENDQKINLKQLASEITNYISKTFTIDDFDTETLFIPTISYNYKDFSFKFLVYTNFQSIEDLLNCFRASSHIPLFSNEKFFLKYNNYMVFDPDFFKFVSFTNKLFNHNYHEISFFKECYNKDYNKYNGQYFADSMISSLKKRNFNLDIELKKELFEINDFISSKKFLF